ncbi:MAG: hypothetical protein K8F91_08510, partial [Candidatus Obscuribacterales bacterium]|nr:hypothetical protein [Candidatus Obscuribacterales bacterium]
MQSIPTPETLLDEAEFTAPESADFASVVDFLTGTLKEHKDVLARGQTLRVMVSEATSKEDIANLCRLFW